MSPVLAAVIVAASVGVIVAFHVISRRSSKVSARVAARRFPGPSTGSVQPPDLHGHPATEHAEGSDHDARHSSPR